MSKFTARVRNFLKSEDGPTAVEYAVMLALIVVVCIGGVSLVGTSANSKFSEINDSLTD
jgi:pilus assembly protein Flp/PilA